MAKPRVFISSTFYDLKQIRANIDLFIEQLGYESVRNEDGDIPYGREEALEEYCYKEIESIDILVSIIGSRFGSSSKRDDSSISQIELKTAINRNKQVYVFIEKNVLAEYETYLLNKDNQDVKYKHADDVRIYKFIEEIKSLKNNNNIHGFEIADHITKYLKEQFAGLFQRMLESQEHIQEVGMLKNIQDTAKTLDRLVTFLSDRNKDDQEEINRIISINHPIIPQLRDSLSISYKFYIETYQDLEELVSARGFIFVELVKDEFMSYYYWRKQSKNKIYHLYVSNLIFDKKKRLLFYRNEDWKFEFVEFTAEDIKEDPDDLPF